MVPVLQLGDTDIGLLSPGASPVRRPCFADKGAGDWTFGDADKAQFHTDALDDTLNTYFLDCAGAQGGDGWRPADLVYEQLRGLLGDGCDGLIVVLSSVYSRSQAECLVGILQAIARRVAVVAAPLAFACSLAPGRHAVAEIGMHDTALTQLRVDGGLAVVEATKMFPNFGLQHIYSRQYAAIRDEFIQRHRYDPDYATTHKAALLKQLYGAWRDGASAEVHLEVEHYGVHVANEKLRVALPEEVARASAGCRLTPLLALPLHRAVAGGEVLPDLSSQHAEALNATDSLQYVAAGDAEAADKVRVFHTLEHRQVA